MRTPRRLLRLAMRSRAHLPEAIWPALLRVASLVPGELPVIGTPMARRVLVVAPHPDDETIGCGGTLALLADTGADVQVVVATDGEATIGSRHRPAATARRRRAEVRAACEALGVGPPTLLGLPDGHLTAVADRLRRDLRAVHDHLDPDLVLTPWPLDRHADHRACAAAVARIVPDDGEVWGYEAHLPLTPTRAVDITAVVERKRAALAAHVTAAGAMDLEATLALNRWRSLPVTGGAGWAEVFLGLTGPDWRRAVRLAAAATPSFRPERRSARQPATEPAPRN